MQSHSMFLWLILLIFGDFTEQFASCEQFNGVFESFDYWDVSDKPVLANGHIGFVPYGESIYMNGLYNGIETNSHRARIPNYGNIQFEPCSRAFSAGRKAADKCSYALDIFDGVFRTQACLKNGQFTVEQIQYVHRYYEMALVNSIRLMRNQGNSGQANETLQLHVSRVSVLNSDDLSIESSKMIKILDKSVVVIKASTKEREDSIYQPKESTVSILYEQIPEIIELLPEQTELMYTWITIIQQNSSNIEETFRKIHEVSDGLLASHTSQWHEFWAKNQITAKGNKRLSDAIQASIFALVSSLPSLNTSQPRSTYFGLSPAGLGLDRQQEVYNGHSFWDTEIWMQPSILLLEPAWSRELLNYRHLMRNTARDNAANSSYKGLRYPWESAYTGIDVTPGAPDVAEYEQHITADIGHALRKHFFASHDFQWFQQIGCDLAYGTAEFWESRISWNETTQRYDINGVMGPDEDHYNINNNAFTNVVAALNLHFGSFASCLCSQLDPSRYHPKTNWSSIARHITLLYDRQLDYNPQYDGYNLNISIKQADVALLGYPLQFANIQASTRRNNINLYTNLTRSNGPAMTWSMHAIGHLEIDSTPLTEQAFNRTYVPYIRLPYHVWNEYANGFPYGAGNFITGAGGFLQLIMYGCAGIRLNVDSLSIQKSQLPPNTDQLKLNGISYMQARFEITLNRDFIEVVILNGRDKLNALIDGVQQNPEENSFHFGYDQQLVLKPVKQPYSESCTLPEDTVDPLNIN